jgi:hypothetical protein
MEKKKREMAVIRLPRGLVTLTVALLASLHRCHIKSKRQSLNFKKFGALKFSKIIIINGSRWPFKLINNK